MCPARVARQQPEVDARRGDARTEREHDRDPDRIGLADAIGRRRDLIVDVEVEDPNVHRRASDLHRAEHALQGDVQRIMYLHLPSILTAYLSFFLVLSVAACTYGNVKSGMIILLIPPLSLESFSPR